MKFSELVNLYGGLPQSSTILKALNDSLIHKVSLEGLVGSSASLLFSSLLERLGRTVVFVLDDADEAGYFFNDLRFSRSYFYPSSYRRAVKYGQRDSANEISRTEALTALSNSNGEPLAIVTHPQAIAELVVSRQHLDDHRITLRTSQTIDVAGLSHRLRELGFKEVDYVYEPGQFALRGSILDVYSYGCEMPYRVDFFGD